MSDEEGNDGTSLYPEIPHSSVIYRNFPHLHLHTHHPHINSFPIGPRDLFLSDNSTFVLSSNRTYPWSFMGTLWPTGSRKLAVSKFLTFLPNGFYHAASGFGQGLPLDQYRSIQLDSTFSLTPEGDRHLDTFRLWESLSCGCIPLVNDHLNSASLLLPNGHPIPVFQSWDSALLYAKDLLQEPKRLDHKQMIITRWWRQYCSDLRSQMSSQICKIPFETNLDRFSNSFPPNTVVFLSHHMAVSFVCIVFRQQILPSFISIHG